MWKVILTFHTISSVPCRTWTKTEKGTSQRVQLEVDFVVNSGTGRVYIQSAFRLHNTEKVEQEQRSLLKIDDSFRKIIIVWDDIKQKIDEQGIITMSLLDFLLDKNSVNKLL